MLVEVEVGAVATYLASTIFTIFSSCIFSGRMNYLCIRQYCFRQFGVPIPASVYKGVCEKIISVSGNKTVVELIYNIWLVGQLLRCTLHYNKLLIYIACRSSIE